MLCSQLYTSLIRLLLESLEVKPLKIVTYSQSLDCTLRIVMFQFPYPNSGTQVLSSRLPDPQPAVAQLTPRLRLLVVERTPTRLVFPPLWSIQVLADPATHWPPPPLLTPPHAPPDEEELLHPTSRHRHEQSS